jgi:hypothetical protein
MLYNVYNYVNIDFELQVFFAAILKTFWILLCNNFFK